MKEGIIQDNATHYKEICAHTMYKSDTLLTFHSFNCTYKNVKTWQNDTKLFYIDTTIYKIVSTNKETRSMSQTP